MQLPGLLRILPATWLGWLLVLLLGWFAYAPGLSGAFLFDDFVNLTALGDFGPVDDFDTFLRYITSGTADPTGRPLALLSFLLDARDWPAEPAPFLRTNLLLHLGNATLLVALLRGLGRDLQLPERQADLAALIGAGMWLLHPLFVSTTLYVVQREAMLPATFIIAGLLAYTHGRRLCAIPGRTRAGLAWIVGGVVLGTGCAVLAKANGILLPALAWVLEGTILRKLPGHGVPSIRWARWLLLVLPSLVLAWYLLDMAADWNRELLTRPWTIRERLLSEPRALAQYLWLLAVPRSVSTGLFNDAFEASRGLLDPPTTIASLLLVAALVALGLLLRRRAPAWSAGLLFFFVGHLLESTSIPLELYFEHRNYVPALLLFWPIAIFLARAGARSGARVAVATLLLGVLAATTWQRATLWGEPRQLAQLWAARNPDSSRAQAVAAIAEMESGRADLARRRLAPLWQQRPHDLQVALNYINAACLTGGIGEAEIARLGNAFASAREGPTITREWLGRALAHATNGRCPGLSVAVVEHWAQVAGRNPLLTTPGAQLRTMPSLQGQIELQKQRPDAALAQFDLALRANGSAEVAAAQVALLASAGYYHHALRHLDHFNGLPQTRVSPGAGMPWLHQSVLDSQDYWPRELRVLRSKLAREIEAEKGGGKP